MLASAIPPLLRVAHRSHLLADVSGYFTAGFAPLTPVRLLDTRSGSKVGALDGTGSAYELQVSGQGGLPASGVAAAALNVTVLTPLLVPTPNAPLYLAPDIYTLFPVKLMPFGKLVPIKLITPD